MHDGRGLPDWCLTKANDGLSHRPLHFHHRVQPPSCQFHRSILTCGKVRSPGFGTTPGPIAVWSDVKNSLQAGHCGGIDELIVDISHVLDFRNGSLARLWPLIFLPI